MTATEQQYAEMSVCRDCVILLANGETDPDWTEEETADFLRRFAEGQEGVEHVTLGSIACEHCGRAAREADPDNTEDCEPWFSWSACDLCGSTLGGDRGHAVAWLLDYTNVPETV